MASHGCSGIAVGGSKHRRQASREMVVQADVALAEASLGGGAQRGSQSRGLIEEIAGHQGGGSSSASHKKDDGVPTTREPKHNSHSPDWLREKFPLYDHYSPNSRGFAIILSLIIFVFSTLCGLAYCIDQYFLPGFRILPIGMALYYVVYSGVRLFVMVEWTIFRTTRRGIQFQPRVAMVSTRSAQVQKLRERLQQNMASKPANAKRPKIVAVIGWGGGGHEATVKGVRDVMTEAGFPPEIIEMPVGFLVETDDKNPVWALTGCTGEQLYNWGLKQRGLIAFVIMWILTLAQATALGIDKFCGLVGQLVGADYGDEAAKVCERVWKEHKPDMVCNFTTGSTEFMVRGLDRANFAHVPFVAIVSDFEGKGAHSWIEDKRQYTVCGTSICRQQALDFGLPAKQVFQTSGMILRPSFYEPDEDDGVDFKERLRKIGLDPERRTCLIFWGGVGSKKVRDIGLSISAASEQLNLIFLCGRNAALVEDLKSIEWPCRVCIQGFTQRVSFYMQLADMIVCKPGPGVCSEAALLGVPIIVEWSCFTLPQEVAVCKWILNRGLGLGFTRSSQLISQVNRMCEMLKADQSVASKHIQQRPVPISEKGLTGFDLSPADNSAVFEVPAIIQDIIDNHVPLSQSSRYAALQHAAS